MWEWLKDKLGVTQLENENTALRAELNHHRKYVSGRLDLLKNYARVDADIGLRGQSTIVLTGVYKKKAFVRFYDVNHEHFEDLVDQMRSMKDHCLIRNVDVPPQMRGMFDIF